ncbi:MAG: DUF4136 domain-containing protein [Kiritimatiellae bacterium]|nr:DUF4136 domain-containing protein [Kiritimatiellia bacterium]
MRPPVFHVNVDSIGDARGNKTYILLPGNKDTKAADLQFREYAAYVNRALQEKGFTPAETFQKANVGIFLGYGIGEPQEHQYVYSLPIWGQTGVLSSYRTGAFSSYGYCGTTIYTPTYGVIGSTTHSSSYTTYSRFISLDAVDLDEYTKTEKEVQLWKTTVTSSGSSDDLRRVFPILIAASKDYIATNTGKKVKVKLLEEDARVMAIKGTGQEQKK